MGNFVSIIVDMPIEVESSFPNSFYDKSCSAWNVAVTGNTWKYI